MKWLTMIEFALVVVGLFALALGDSALAAADFALACWAHLRARSAE